MSNPCAEGLETANAVWNLMIDRMLRDLFWHDGPRFITPPMPSLLNDPDLKKTWDDVNDDGWDEEDDDDTDYSPYTDAGVRATSAPSTCTVCGSTRAWIFVDHAATKALVCIGCKDVVPEGWVPCPVTHGHLPFCNLCKDTPRFLPESK